VPGVDLWVEGGGGDAFKGWVIEIERTEAGETLVLLSDESRGNRAVERKLRWVRLEEIEQHRIQVPR
jgi:hypothetical protein